jgi:hypothetical protein
MGQGRTGGQHEGGLINLELLTSHGAKLSGFGAKPERTGLGPHALP